MPCPPPFPKKLGFPGWNMSGTKDPWLLGQRAKDRYSSPIELSWSKHVVNQNYIAYKEKQLQHIFENMEKKKHYGKYITVFNSSLSLRIFFCRLPPESAAWGCSSWDLAPAPKRPTGNRWAPRQLLTLQSSPSLHLVATGSTRQPDQKRKSVLPHNTTSGMACHFYQFLRC